MSALPISELGRVADTRKPGDYRRRGADGPPYVVDPTGALTLAGKPRSLLYGRPSGFSGWIEDGYGLARWNETNVAVGLLDLLGSGEISTDSEVGDAVIVRAKRRAGAFLGSDRGTFVHHVLETGEISAAPELGISDNLVRAVISGWAELLDRYGLEVLAAEVKGVDDVWRLAGTIDAIVCLRRALTFGRHVIPAGTVCVLDYKSGKRNDDYWLGYPVQIASYAQTVGYVIRADGSETREPWPWPIDQRSGLIVHLDLVGALDTDVLTFTLCHVDLVAGRRAGDLCAAARDWNKSTGVIVDADEAPVCETVPGPTKLETLLEQSLELVETRKRATETIARAEVALAATPIDPWPNRPDTLPAPEEVLLEPLAASVLRTWLQERIDVLGVYPAAGADLVRLWPTGVPSLRASEAHTPEELADIEALLDELEARHSIPFGPSRPGAPNGRAEDVATRLLRVFPGSTITNESKDTTSS